MERFLKKLVHINYNKKVNKIYLIIELSWIFFLAKTLERKINMNQLFFGL